VSETSPTGLGGLTSVGCFLHWSSWNLPSWEWQIAPDRPDDGENVFLHDRGLVERNSPFWRRELAKLSPR
jgi:hypothetical protein